MIEEQFNISVFTDQLGRSRDDDERIQLLTNIVQTLFGRKPQQFNKLMASLQGSAQSQMRGFKSQRLSASKMPKLKKIITG
jgi:hypothetical protein